MTPRDLKDFRDRMHLTQQECAKALGCSPMSITAWESGTTAIPDSVALAASAYAFGLPAYRTSLDAVGCECGKVTMEVKR